MPFNGDTFTRLYSWVANAANGIKIRSDYMDQDTNDIATGMTALATRVTAASTAATGALRTDSNGNVGVGAAASPWTMFNAIEGAADTALASKFSVQIVSNAYSVGGVWKYTTTGGASRMVTNQGVTTFYNAPSGTSGATVTWNQVAQMDANSNFGLAATPSPWGAGGNHAIEIGTTASYFGNNNSAIVANNWYFGTVDTYKTTAAASRYQQFSGTHLWQTAASGTAGGTITFASVMLLDASGNLMVGPTTSPYSAAGRKVLSIQGSTDSLLAFQGAGDYAWSDTTGNKFEIAAAGATKSIVFVANGAPRMTISSAGVISDSTAELGWKDVPVNSQGSGYTLVLADRGKQVLISTGGVTVPNAVFSAGAIITITNNSGTAQTITQGTSVTMHQAGTTNTGNRTLAPWGICSVLFIAGSNCIISGNIS